MEKMSIYKQLREVPKEAQKTIAGGRLAGMTDIKPMWRIEKLTEVFGVCGFGWKTTIKNKEIIDGANDEKIAIVDIDLFIKDEFGEWSEPIEGTGGSSFIAKEKNGLYTNDECFKMAYTDALSVACKSLGMGADVYWGDSKYAKPSEEVTLEEALEYTLPFGKHKGKRLTEVPEDYIEWMLGNSTDERILKLIELATGKKVPSEDEMQEKLMLMVRLNNLIEQTNQNRETLYKKYKVTSDKDMTIEQLKEAIEILNNKVGE